MAPTRLSEREPIQRVQLNAMRRRKFLYAIGLGGADDRDNARRMSMQPRQNQLGCGAFVLF